MLYRIDKIQTCSWGNSLIGKRSWRLVTRTCHERGFVWSFHERQKLKQRKKKRLIQSDHWCHFVIFAIQVSDSYTLISPLNDLAKVYVVCHDTSGQPSTDYWQWYKCIRTNSAKWEMRKWVNRSLGQRITYRTVYHKCMHNWYYYIIGFPTWNIKMITQTRNVESPMFNVPSFFIALMQFCISS